MKRIAAIFAMLLSSNALAIGSNSPVIWGPAANTATVLPTTLKAAAVQITSATTSSVLNVQHTGSSSGSLNGAIRVGDPTTLTNGTGIYMRTSGEASFSTASTTGYFNFYNAAAVKFAIGTSTSRNDIVIGEQAALATNATTGFMWIPTSAGTPTGVPSSYTGKVAMEYDTTNNKICIYNGGWHCSAAM